MPSKSTIQRAYELAEAGEALDLSTLKAMLSAEGYTQIDAHLEGRTVRAALRNLMAAHKSVAD